MCDRYHIFLSYAKADNHEGKISTLIHRLEQRFQAIAGRTPRIFFDATEINTAQLWEERIQAGLANSHIMVAMLSPSYFTSEWCGREWEFFVTREDQERATGNLRADQGLIFPLKLADWDRILHPTQDERDRIAAAETKQYRDFREFMVSGSFWTEFDDELDKLVREIIAILNVMETLPNWSGTSIPVVAPALITRIGTNREQFIERLSQADHVIIVGLTHPHLVEYLEEALRRMRAEQGPEAFWQQIRIVFLSEPMLPFVEHEFLNQSQDREQANSEHIRNTGHAKRVLYRFFSRLEHPDQWSLYEYHAMLPFLGIIFELPDGKKIVQVATLRLGYPESAHLFFELSGMSSDITYYQSAFEEIIQKSARYEVLIRSQPKKPLKTLLLEMPSEFDDAILERVQDQGREVEF